MALINTFAPWEQYLLYLRKSRSDDPKETVEEVLAKHEIQLQEYSVREFGGKIPEENIYREVVSGESIEDREEIKKVLLRIEDPNIKGVIVIEPSRLSRGDLEDCGRLINDLRYTNTLVATPYMTYDLENKMERKFFQDELLRGRDYLEYTKEILWRGRVAAAKRGCYSVGGPPPFGYKKIKIGKDNTLEIVPEEAEIVRLIFDWYTKEGMSPGAIARKLTEMGLKPRKKDVWVKITVRNILCNEHYRGKIVFNKKKQTTIIENGERLVKRITQKPEDVIVVEGKHEPIIDQATWEIAKNKIKKNPRYKFEHTLKNPLSSLLICDKCGAPMQARHPDAKGVSRYECRTVPRCYRSVLSDVLNEHLLITLRDVELPELKLKLKNGEGNSMKIQQNTLEKLEKQLADFLEQEEKQFDLLEQKIYTEELFERRHRALSAKIKNCKEEIAKVKKSIPKSVNYEERISTLEKAIDIFDNPEVPALEKNKILKTIINRIEFKGTPNDGTRNGAGGAKKDFDLKVFLQI